MRKRVALFAVILAPCVTAPFGCGSETFTPSDDAGAAQDALAEASIDGGSSDGASAVDAARHERDSGGGGGSTDGGAPSSPDAGCSVGKALGDTCSLPTDCCSTACKSASCCLPSGAACSGTDCALHCCNGAATIGSMCK